MLVRTNSNSFPDYIQQIFHNYVIIPIMNNGKVTILRNIVQQRFLPFVQRPGRYIGGEVNQIKKDLDNCEVKVALCFPDVYEIAMSNTAIAILYNILNQMPNVAAERLFAPWTDAEKILRDKNIPLFTLESMAAAGNQADNR